MCSHPITTHEKENELPEDIDHDDEPTPAEHWSRIVELAKAIELGAQDLQDQLKDFNKSAL